MAEDFPVGLPLHEACARMVALGAARRLGAESVPLASALGRVLAQDVLAPIDLPPFANSAMDGFAVRAADVAASCEVSLRIVGTRLAGDGRTAAIGPGECLRITTGAPLPQGADAIAIKENVRVSGDTAHVGGPLAPGTHVRAVGEDLARGAPALAQGSALDAGALSLLAACGFTHAPVVRAPAAVLLTTGDELVEPGGALGAGQIYDSNRSGLVALLGQSGARVLRHERVRDDPAALRAALLAACDGDLVLTSGGVSAGEADFLPRLLQEIGRVHLWKVRMKPGMPLLVGEVAGTLLCCLPGNPVSGTATFLALVRPAIDAMLGRAARQPRRARLAVPVHKRHARAEYLRAQSRWDADGTLWVTPLRGQGSGMLHALAQADCLALIPEDVPGLDLGAVVEVLALPGRS